MIVLIHINIWLGRSLVRHVLFKFSSQSEPIGDESFSYLIETGYQSLHRSTKPSILAKILMHIYLQKSYHISISGEAARPAVY